MCGLFACCGCNAPIPNDVPSGKIAVVLTFDDGPIGEEVSASDILKNDSENKEVFLKPLNRILDTLANHNAQAVFYILGPGNTAPTDELKRLYAKGIESIHQRGHILGYHAYSHDFMIWTSLLNIPPIGKTEMFADLLRLKNFIDDVMNIIGAKQSDYFTKIFRQPYGGMGKGWIEGENVSFWLGWTYHGFDIDSGDWIGTNVHTKFNRNLNGFADERKHTNYVIERIRKGASKWSKAKVVDILFHVNSFTSNHLDEWMGEIKSSFELASGRDVLFVVPDSYLRISDPVTDESVSTDMAVSFVEDLIGR